MVTTNCDFPPREIQEPSVITELFLNQAFANVETPVEISNIPSLKVFEVAMMFEIVEPPEEMRIRESPVLFWNNNPESMDSPLTLGARM